MTGSLVEHRRSRGETWKAKMLRRSAVQEHARLGLQQIMGRLEDRDAEFKFEVLRALLRAAGALLASRAGKARAVGVLAGVLTSVSPAWKSEREEAHDAADAVFRREPV